MKPVNIKKDKKETIDKTEHLFYLVIRTNVPIRRRIYFMEKDDKLKALDAALGQIESSVERERL